MSLCSCSCLLGVNHGGEKRLEEDRRQQRGSGSSGNVTGERGGPLRCLVATAFKVVAAGGRYAVGSRRGYRCPLLLV